MGFKTSFTIFIFIFVTSTQRAFVYGRLKGEVLRGYCETNDTFITRDNNFARRIQQTFRKNVHKLNLECKGNTTVSPGTIIKEINTTWPEFYSPERCTFKIQAPEDYRVYVYSYSYKFVTIDECASSSRGPAGLAGFYDGTLDENSLLYRTLTSGYYDHDVSKITNAVSTGRELLIDLNLTGQRESLNIKQMKYQRLIISYAFIKKDNGKVIVYGENKA